MWRPHPYAAVLQIHRPKSQRKAKAKETANLDKAGPSSSPTSWEDFDCAMQTRPARLDQRVAAAVASIVAMAMAVASAFFVGKAGSVGVVVVTSVIVVSLVVGAL